MAQSPSIREATIDEAEALSDLAYRSKASWGYTHEFMESCRTELTVDASRIGSDKYRYFVAQEGDSIIGFYALELVDDNEYELEALFVEPKRIGSGIGRLLVQHAVNLLSLEGVSRLVIQGDPNATNFYVAAGARHIGERESASIPGRYLPLFEIALERR